LDALIFDFDGVIVDSEPVHLMCFQQVLEAYGIRLTNEQYYGRYLGYDDHDCFFHVLRDHGVALPEAEISRMIESKTALVQQTFAESVQPMPGTAALIRAAAAAAVPMAICSGALRHEIEMAAQAVGVRDYFTTVIAAEDVAHGKPDPEGYGLALGELSRLAGRTLRKYRSVVVEDAPAGIEAAKAVGMKVLAVTNSYRADALEKADRIVASLADVTLASLDDMLSQT
jgi:beta-phosphoglucomutase